MQPSTREEIFKTSDDCSVKFRLRAARNSDAPRIVLIHSLALDGSIWDGVAARLTDQAVILTYDCRGHGKSGRRVETFTTELFARDLAELLDHIGWTTATVAGCSMGGCVAQAFAGQYPSRLNGLGLIDTTAWYGEDAPKNWRERANTARSKGLKGMVEFQATRWFSDPFRTGHPEVVKAMTEIFLANDLNCYAATCVMLGDADLRHFLPALRVPVAVIVGEEDYATPVAMAQMLHEAIRGSTLAIIPGGRHLTPVECPEQIASQLLTLLQRVGSQQAGAEA
jgi:3-oxoadipate enol-lactonase